TAEREKPLDIATSAVNVMKRMQALPLDKTGIGDEEPVGLRAEMMRWAMLMQRAPEELTTRAGELGGRLAAQIPVERPPTLVHGDYHFGNMLFRGADVVAVLDWEIAELGQPLLDIGCLCSMTVRRRFVDAPSPGGAVAIEMDELFTLYGVDADEMRWYVALSLYKYAAILGYSLMHEIEGASIWGPIVFGNQAPDSGNSEILAHFGTEEQKKRWLQPLLDGKIRSAFSMTEPNTAGSDPTLLSTIAELDGDEWVINGHKWFTSNGMIAVFLIAMVVTEAKADAYERASMIIVPADTSGLKKVRNIPTLAGEHERFGYGHAEVLYENVRVPQESLLGERGQGFLIAQARLGPGRIHHCMRWLGQARRAFDMLCERALQREAFGKKLASHQTVQNWIADSAAEMQAARLMT